MRIEERHLAALSHRLSEDTTLPTRNSETIRQFMDALSSAGREAAKQQFGDRMHVHLIDANSDSVVFNVYSYAEGSAVDTYIRVNYTRSADAAFEFGEAVEMVRVVSFEEAAPGQRQLLDGVLSDETLAVLSA